MSKKFSIKPFRTHTPMDTSSATDVWNQLGSAIEEIHSRNASLLSFEELYRHAYNLVLHKHGNLLYDGVAEKIGDHLSILAESVASSHDENLLSALSGCWNDHVMTMIMVRDILMYMDRTYVVQNKKKPVYDLGLQLFRTIVWEHEHIQSRVTTLLLNSISRERDGQIVDESLLKSNLSMLLDLGQSSSGSSSNVYESDFESVFLGTTQEFYRLESLEYLSRNTASEYVKKAENRLGEEHRRATRYLSPTTESPLTSIVETELVDRHAKTLVEMEHSGFAALLKDSTHKMDDLRRMYDLFARVPLTVDFLRNALSENVKATGKILVSDQEKGLAEPTAFVKGVLTMRKKYSEVVEGAFRSEKRCQKRLRESFEDFLNADSRAASCLAVYVDELLRGGLKGLSEARVDEELNKVILIFRYLQDKDVFESFYKQHLAKRLLNQRSVSEEAERAMVSLLKAECGYQFTSKLEGMFNDMRISRDTRESYRNFKLMQQQQAIVSGESKSSGMVDIEVDVLTTGYWPSQAVPQCILPNSVKSAIERFNTFYLQKHTGRKLSWQTSTGSAELRATFGEGSKLRRHDFCVSTYQMCALVLFNDSPTKTLAQIREATNIPDAELRRHLISLCTPKHRVLRKSSRGKIIASDETFTFNKDFTSKLKRVKIPLVSMKETQRDSSGNLTKNGIGSGVGDLDNGMVPVPASVEEDRRHAVEAAIVRIMKARKSLHHNDLIAEVSKQLSVRFVPPLQFVKKRIESLIEREYVERSGNDRRLYMYVA